MASSNFIKSQSEDQITMVPLTVNLLKNKYIDKLSLGIKEEVEPTNTDDDQYSDRLDIMKLEER